ncbi:hypothetical protein E2F46_15205 [Luteimonas aestuarii]|uniref:MFS transporter permease n=1 Tax=Luteimonas aestuarii TaxID=453837 RepID=A0A4V3ALB8_9GAMM|nr:hypothetical protein [Luteimonas aestuarii]TDK21045.1 hypothetical protein E2F46_15205 [Luteimonas aestuarii]
MDFLKILKSFEEFVYEALTWLLLLPRTLLRIVLHPRRMTRYAATELGDGGEGRFDDAISPPLLLILCVLVAHFIDLAIRAQAPAAPGTLASVLLASEQNLLLYRTIAFGVWAMAGAACFLWRTGVSIGRTTLRRPFYEQCYLVAPFALVLSISGSLMLMGERWLVVGGSLTLAGGLWLWLVQVDWIRARTHSTWWHALVFGTLVLLVGSVVNALVGHALSHTRHADVSEAAARNDAPEDPEIR